MFCHRSMSQLSETLDDVMNVLVDEYSVPKSIDGREGGKKLRRTK